MLSNAIRYFIAVAECESIHMAAERLRIAQSAVSRQMQRLEQIVGAQLLERHARGIKLTEAGQLVLKFANQQFLQAEQLKLDLKEISGGESSVLNIQCVEGFAASRLPGILMRFSAQHPNVRLSATVAYSDSILEALHSGTCDLGISFTRPQGDTLEVLASAPEGIMALLSPAHALAQKARISLSDMQPYPIIVPSIKGGTRAILEAACKEEGTRLSIAAETNSSHLITNMLRTGEYMALLPTSSTLDYRLTGNFLAIPMENSSLSRGAIMLLRNRNKPLPPTSGFLVNMLIEAISSHHPQATTASTNPPCE